jgi:Secretion system C-terminal sorting domain
LHSHNTDQGGNCIGFAIASTQQSWIGSICGEPKSIAIDEAYAKNYWMTWGFYNKYDFNGGALSNDILIWDSEPENINHCLSHAAVVTSAGSGTISIKWIDASRHDNTIHYSTLYSSNNYADPSYGTPNYRVRWNSKTYGYAITVKTSFNSGSVKVDGVSYNIYGSNGTLVSNLSRGDHNLYADETQYNGNEPVGYKEWRDKYNNTIASYPNHTAVINLDYNNGFGGEYTANYVPIYQVSFQNHFVYVGNGGVITVNGTQYNSPTGTFNVKQGNTITASAQDQTINGIEYGFDHWSYEGGTASYYTFRPDQNRTYTAYFIGRPDPTAINFMWDCVVGQPIQFHWTDNPNTGVTQYKIWRWVKHNGVMGDKILIATVGRGVQTFTDNDYAFTRGYTVDLLFYDVRQHYSTENTDTPEYWHAAYGQLLPKENDQNAVNIGKITEYTFGFYPNPFNPSTNISYQIPKDGMVSLKIYDMLGREIKTLVNRYQNTGKYEIYFNAVNLPSGVYLCMMKSGDYVSVKKLMLVK